MGDGTRAPHPDHLAAPRAAARCTASGEKFAPDLHTGTGNFTVPIAVPAGPQRLPAASWTSSTAPATATAPSVSAGALSVPGVSRKTSRMACPAMTTTAGRLHPVRRRGPRPGRHRTRRAETRYRPRTEGLFARIVHHRDPAPARLLGGRQQGRPGQPLRQPPPDDARGWRDPAVIADPDDRRRIFAWKLTQTTRPVRQPDRLRLRRRRGRGRRPHAGDQPLPAQIRYADYTADRPEPAVPGRPSRFELRRPRRSVLRATAPASRSAPTQRCRAITIEVHPEQATQPVRRYAAGLRDQRPAQRRSRCCSSVHGGRLRRRRATPHRELPPLEFGYTSFEPEQRRFEPVTGPDLPPALAGATRLRTGRPHRRRPARHARDERHGALLAQPRRRHVRPAPRRCATRPAGLRSPTRACSCSTPTATAAPTCW